MATNASLALVNSPGRPCMNRGVNVSERPLVSWQLPVRMHVPLAKEKKQLLFGEIRVNQGQRYAMKGKVPRRIPGILPFVGHRNHEWNHLYNEDVISTALALFGRRRAGRIAFDPRV